MELKSKESKGASTIEWVLWAWGITNLFSAIMWTFTGSSDKWLWFSRLALGVICFGFAGVIREIRKLREKDD
jgi:hypothetical protein